MIKRIPSILLLAVVISFPVYADKDSDNQQEKAAQKLQHEITVTANRIETSVKETASSLSVITREELEKLQKRTVYEALKEVVGLNTIQNGPPGSIASASIRGANSEHTKVLMDGVEMNDPISPSRSFNLGHLLIENIERIEIIRGPQSTLYGSDAMGGVINIITRQRQGKSRFNLSTQGGSFNTLTENAGISGSIESFSYSMGISHYRTDGFSAASDQYEGNHEKDGYKNLSIFGKAGLSLRKNISLDFSFRTCKTNSDIDSFGGPNGDDPNHTEKNRSLILNSNFRALFLQNRWETKLSLAYIDYSRIYDNPKDELHPFSSDDSLYKSSLVKLDWQNNFFTHDTNTITAGLEFTHEQGESEYHSQGIWGPFENIFPLQTASRIGAYIQDRINISDRFFSTFGARLENHSKAGIAFTFRIAPAFFFAKTGTKIKATLGTGFKAPSLYQLYAPGTIWGPVGNQKLNAEKSSAWDAGIEQNLFKNHLTLGLTIFSNRFKNLIDFDYLYGYLNIGKASTQGLEFICKAYPGKNLLLSAAYTRMEARDVGTDENLLRRPKDKFSAQLIFNFLEKADMTITLLHVGKRVDNFFSGFTSSRVTMNSYTLLNATAASDIFRHTRVFIRFDNILNKRYEVIKGYGSPGFSIYCGFKLDF